MKRLPICALIMLITAACTKISEPSPNGIVSNDNEGTTTQYNFLPDPYAIENMQAIYDEFNVDITLKPTDLYVRILPQNSMQVAMLEDTYDLDFFDYPLDLDIPAGEKYVDPTIPEGEFTWQYTTVKPDFVFPKGVVYEIIRECYIPEDDEVIELNSPITRGGTKTISVEKAALERLGYDVQTETRSGGGGGQYPEGNVYVRGNNNENVPFDGIRVKIHSKTKINEVYTNSNGHFKANRKFWDKNLKYNLVFINENYDFILWDLNGISFSRAKHEVSMTKWGGNIHINDGVQWYWGAIYTGACDYYKMTNTTGIPKPPKDLKILCLPEKYSFGGASCAMMARRMNFGSGAGSTRRLIEKVVKEVGGESALVASTLGTVFETNGPDLMLATSTNGYARTYRSMYNTINHELSHASHFSQVGKGYWEKYVRYILNSLLESNGRESYGNGTGEYAGICEVGEMWGYAMGNIQEYEKYENARLSQPYYNPPYPFRSLARAGLEGTVGDGGWIKPDPLWALYTKKVLTKKQIYDCLTSDVDSKKKLEDKLCARYPSSAKNIREAFANNR